MTTFDRLSVELAAARLSQATNPQHITLTAHRRFEKFAAEVTAEAGTEILADIVAQVRRHADLTRGRAA